MNKPYITKLIWIIEGIAYLITLTTLGYAVYYAGVTTGEVPTHYDFAGNITGYGSAKQILVEPIVMLLTNLLLSASVHILPDRFYTLPKRAEGATRFRMLYDAALMIVLLILEFSIFSLICTLNFGRSGSAVLYSSVYLTIACFITIIALFIKMCKEP